jgi:DNA repair protein SbcC/Rad50
MVPEVLELRDFLCYASLPRLDLREVRLACLVGPNGAGKSALLDAITWALWGRARGCEGGQHQDRVIRQGQDRASVRLTFRLANQRYRVHRARHRRGRSELTFEAETDGSWHEHSCASVEETDDAIAARLHLDYHSFVHSAYLLQGRAGAFAELTPARRQEVLTKVLEIGHYADLAEEARSRLRQADRLLVAAGARREDAATRARELSVDESEYQEARRAAEQADRSEREANHALEAGLEAAAVCRPLNDRLAGLSEERSQLLSENVLDQEKLERLACEREELKVGDERALLERQQQLEDLDRLLSSGAEISSRLREAQGELASVQLRIAEITAAAEARIEEVRRRAEGPPAGRARALEQALEAATADLAHAEKAEERRHQAAAALTRSTAHVEVCARELEATKARLERARRAALTLFDREASSRSCPLCGGPLTEGAKVHLTQAVEEALAEHAQASATLCSAREIEERRRHEGRAATRDADGLRAARLEVAARHAELEQLRQAACEAEAARAELGLLMAQRTLVGQGEREKSSSLSAEIARLEREANAREQLERERSQLADRLAAHRSALAQRARLQREREEVASRQSARDARLNALAREATRLSFEIGRLEAQDLTALRAQSQAASTRRDSCRDRFLQLEGRVAEHRRAVEVAQEASGRAAEAARECDAFRHLVDAFGRRGIPARVIESAIPEIQAEANSILDRLSLGHLAVSLETLRETRQGSLVDSLDISVWAEGRPRDVAVLSGGEALRVGFALRVALARLLARRTGTRLETLVVDEGFGTQDSESRARMVEVIRQVSDEFALVLVVTHMDDVKDLFSHRVEVSKDPAGASTARLVHG